MENKTIKQKLKENNKVYLAKSEYSYNGHYTIDHQEYGNPSIRERFLIVPNINIVPGKGWKYREKLLKQLQVFGTDLHSYLELNKEKGLFYYGGLGVMFSNFKYCEPFYDEDTRRPGGIRPGTWRPSSSTGSDHMERRSARSPARRHAPRALLRHRRSAARRHWHEARRRGTSRPA